MALVNGTNLVLYVSDGGVDKAFGHSRSFTLNVEANTIDATSRASAGWSEFLMGSRTFSLDFEGLVSYDDDINVEWLQTAVENKTKFLVKFTDNLAGNLIYNGYVYISNLSIDSPNEDVVTYSGTLQGTEIFSTTVITPGDPDVDAFLSATGITDPTQVAAITALVEDLKAESLWNKFYAIYPFVGGTATTHKFNLKNPLDSDVAFRLQFNGTWSHTPDGVLPTSNDAYGNTFIINKPTNNIHLSFYSRTTAAATYFDTALGYETAESTISLAIRNLESNAVLALNMDAVAVSNSDGKGFYIGTKQSSTSQKLFKNGALIVTGTGVSQAPSTITTPIFFGSSNTGDLGLNNFYRTNKQCAFATVGETLTDPEIVIFNSIVQDFQTALSRQV